MGQSSAYRRALIFTNIYQNGVLNKQATHFVLKTNNGFGLIPALPETVSMARHNIILNGKLLSDESAKVTQIIAQQHTYMRTLDYVTYSWNPQLINLTFEGTPHQEYLFGTDGDDLLQGYGGGDHLIGLTGKDTYIVRKGDGNTYISNYDTNETIDTLMVDVEANALTFEKRANALAILHDNIDPNLRCEIEVNNYFSSTAYQHLQLVTPTGLLYQLSPNNNDSVDMVALNKVGTESLDLIVADDHVDGQIIQGLGGDDYLYAGSLTSGNKGSILFGGKGDDELSAGRGNDQLFGGAGNDRLVINSATSEDLLVGGSGNDDYVIYGRTTGVITVDNEGAIGEVDTLHLNYIPSNSSFGLAKFGDSLMVLQKNTAGNFIMDENQAPVVIIRDYYGAQTQRHLAIRTVTDHYSTEEIAMLARVAVNWTDVATSITDSLLTAQSTTTEQVAQLTQATAAFNADLAITAMTRAELINNPDYSTIC